MPIFHYLCKDKNCETVTSRLCKSSERDDAIECAKCGGITIRLLSTPLGAIVKETPDKYIGKSVKVGLNEQLKQRSHEHFMNNEIDGLIQKYGVKHAKDVGWIDRKTGKKRNLLDEK